MAFDRSQFGVAVDTIAGGLLRIHSYETTDEFATVSAANYFTRTSEWGVRPGDLICVTKVDTLETQMGTVQSVNTAGHATVKITAFTDELVKIGVVTMSLGAWLQSKLDAAARGAVNGVAPLGSDGKINPSYIPIIPTTETIFASGDLTTLTAPQQAAIDAGDRVITSAGNEYAYSGTGSKTNSASYVLLANVSAATLGLGSFVGLTTATLPLSTAATNALAGKLATASNLSDLANAGAARTNLGLGALAVKSSIITTDLATTVPARYFAAVASRKANAVGDFGCPTDQTSDCRAAIQAGIDAIWNRYGAAVGGGTLELPPIRLALNGSLLARDGIVLEGTGGSPPVGPDSLIKGTCFYPTATNFSLITQASFNDFLHSFEIRSVGFDGLARYGANNLNAIYISGGSCHIEKCYIRDFDGTGIYLARSTSGLPCWTHWIFRNQIDRCKTNFNCEATDSYIGYNYFVNAYNQNVILNGPGANTFTNNHVDNAGMNTSGTTVNAAAIGLLIKNQGASGADQYQCCNMVANNEFISNPTDIYIADIGGFAMNAGHTIATNRFHDNRGGPCIFVGNNNNGGQIVTNMFRSMHTAGQACVVFAGGNTNTDWHVGPNAFFDVTVSKYANLPATTTVSSGRLVGVN